MPFTFPFSFFNFHFPVSLTVPGTSFQGITVFFQKSKFKIIIFLNLPHWKLNYIEIETEKIRGHCARFKSSKCLFRAYYKFTLHLSKQPPACQRKIIYIQFLAGLPLRIRRQNTLNLTKNIYYWWSCDPLSPNSD